MKRVIIDKALFNELVRINSACDTYCTVLDCSLVQLHENSDLFACVHSTEDGFPCKVYVANDQKSIERHRAGIEETEWIEVIGGPESERIHLCRISNSRIERSPIFVGSEVAKITRPLAHTMERLSNDHNSVYIITNSKAYDEADREALQKRSVIDLSAIDSSGVDIIYFDGADKLIEKLLYGGCRELNVFITDIGRAKAILESLKKLSRKAPFSNRLTVIVGECYAPKSKPSILVSKGEAATVGVPAHIFFSVNYAEGEGVGVSVGQNTANIIPDPSEHHLKPYTLHYVTSVMSELILHAVSTKQYHARRLFKVNAKSLVTETVIKEG